MHLKTPFESGCGGGEGVVYKHPISMMGRGMMLTLDDIIQNALREDIHTGDLTTQAVVPEPRAATARLVAKESLTVAGMAVAARVFSL